MELLQFRPILKRIRWGGRRLGTVLGKPLGPENDYAESWGIADHGADQSLVADGPYAGQTLNRLIREHSEALLGDHAGLKQFPLLVKFLDAHDLLSVQVHPDDEQAARFDPAEKGKTEAWVILQADPGSVIYAGLKPGVDRESLQSHLAAGTVEDCLHSFPVTPGDCVFVPAGTVHAIGAGILLAEIQQSSDMTFRLYDWGRTGSDGRPRPLHIEEALSCIDFSRGPVEPVQPRPVPGAPACEELVHCDYFVLRRHRSDSAMEITADSRFHILMVLTGRGEIACADEHFSVETGRTVLMPARSADVVVHPDGEITLLETFLPD